MFFFRAICAFAAATAVLANPLAPRQSGNNNVQIAAALDALSVATRNHLFQINTLQANNTASDSSVGPIVQQMVTNFESAASALNAIPVGSGSTTVQPTNIELSRTLGETLQVVGTGLSGLQSQGSVPGFGDSVGQLDPAVAATVTALNTTLPGTEGFVHTLLLDVKQFYVDQGVWPETLAATGF